MPKNDRASNVRLDEAEAERVALAALVARAADLSGHPAVWSLAGAAEAIKQALLNAPPLGHGAAMPAGQRALPRLLAEKLLRGEGGPHPAVLRAHAAAKGEPHGHGDEGLCPVHGLFPSNLEAFALVATLSHRLGEPLIDPDGKMLNWRGGSGEASFSVEVALGHGRPVVEVIGDGDEADMVLGLCQRRAVSCLDEDGDAVAGPPPAADPWADEREAPGEAAPQAPHGPPQTKH